jgi:4-diphosphocytidyl-2-C-methyl-D-erythritol kinase
MAFELTLPSFAKINWTLRILGRRPDGLHEIQTIFQTITLSDRLNFARLEDGRVEIYTDSLSLPTGEANLVHRAASALQKRFGVRRGARIRIEKRIPIGGGLGGGSSNAAITLLALARLWELDVSGSDLIELGAELGADVPFFFLGGTALGYGTGRKVKPLPDVEASHLLIIVPSVKISTAEAYSSLNAPALTNEETAHILFVSRKTEDLVERLQGVLRNDFEPTVFRSYPEVRRAHEALLEGGAKLAFLSGSGSSVVGLFDNEEESQRAASMLLGAAVGRIELCSTLGRDQYRARLGECAALLASSNGEEFHWGVAKW